MRTTTCKTFKQSKMFYQSCCELANLISYVYNNMLIVVIASLLLWCTELVTSRKNLTKITSSMSCSLSLDADGASYFIFTFMHLADAFIQSDLLYASGYTFSGYTFRFRLYIFFVSMYVSSLGIEPTTFALLTQCSTTEPLEHGTGPFPGCCCGFLYPHCSHQTLQILQKYTSSQFNPPPPNIAITLPCRPCSTTEDLQQMHRNQESEKCCNNCVGNDNN